MERPLVQILVVVAITQVRILRAEVGKGSILTVVGYGLAGPESQVNSDNVRGVPHGASGSKGNHVNIHERVRPSLRSGNAHYSAGDANGAIEWSYRLHLPR